MLPHSRLLIVAMGIGATLTADHLKVTDVVSALKTRGIECLAISDRLLRWVFHLDINDDMVS